MEKLNYTKKNTNKDIYGNEMFEEWANKNHFLDIEKYFLGKYLINKNDPILEAGTGGGRLAFHIEKLGCTDITSFDIVPRMINHAKKRGEKENSKVTFLVADASDLSQFKDESFGYLLYPQQILNFIENENEFNKALKESYRLGKKNSIAIFAFLDYDSRTINPILSFLINSIRYLRKEKIRKQHLPWLVLNKKINRKFLAKNQALSYWVKKRDIMNRLRQIGFNILETKNQSQINNEGARAKGILFIVCEKT